MVPKIHKKGKSFQGAATYILHDKGTTETRNRLDWTETRNLATDDPDLAWRIMAATAMDQARLKEEAGIPTTGRKSKDHVLHITLSWHADEREGLTQEEMNKAASQALHALNAADRQALIAAHNDTDEPHIHILVNRVSMTDGRMLSSSKEKLKLSQWAQKYEEERGEVLCPNRVVNNAARERGQYTRDKSDRAYHLKQAEAANQNTPGFERVRDQQRAKDAELARRRREQEQRRAEAWAATEARQSEDLKAHDQNARRSEWNAQKSVQAEYRSGWEELHRRQAQERGLWDTNEQKFLGRLRNALRVTDWGSLREAEHRKERLAEMFGAFSSSGARLEALKREHEAQQEALRKQQLAEERRRCEEITRQQELQRAERVALQQAERQSHVLTHNLEDAAERARWQQRNDERQAAYDLLHPHARPESEKAREKYNVEIGNTQPQQHESSEQESRDEPGDGLSESERRWIKEYLGDQRPSNDNTRDQGHDRSR